MDNSQPHPREIAEHAFLNGFSAMTDLTFKTHVDKGWTKEADPKSNAWRGLQIALMHSELSEALEGQRKNLMDDKLPHRTMLECELADTVIRILNFSRQCGLDVGSAIVEKARFNDGREYMHGGKLF